MPLLPPNQIPAPLPPWARLLLQLLPYLPAAQQSVLDYIMELFDSDAPEPTTWCRTQVVWELVGNIDPADRYGNTFDTINITNGAVDNSWTTDDFDDVKTGLLAMINGVLEHYSNQTRCKEMRHYLMYFQPIIPPEDRAPDWKDDPYGPSGPPARIDPVMQAGTSPGLPLPAQCAMTHTEKTPYPRHWGRSYWPAPSTIALSGTGHINSTIVLDFADSIAAGVASLTAAEKFPVVPVVQVDNEPFRGLLTVDHIQVDNVWDTIRRRRASTTTQRVVRP